RAHLPFLLHVAAGPSSLRVAETRAHWLLGRSPVGQRFHCPDPGSTSEPSPALRRIPQWTPTLAQRPSERQLGCNPSSRRPTNDHFKLRFEEWNHFASQWLGRLYYERRIVQLFRAEWH